MERSLGEWDDKAEESGPTGEGEDAKGSAADSGAAPGEEVTSAAEGEQAAAGIKNDTQNATAEADPPVIREIGCTKFLTPSAFIFLYEAELFLTFRDLNVHVWDFQGKQLQQFRNQQSQSNAVYITSSQDLIISMSNAEGPEQSSSINVADILTGKCLTKITADSSDFWLNSSRTQPRSVSVFHTRETSPSSRLRAGRHMHEVEAPIIV